MRALLEDMDCASAHSAAGRKLIATAPGHVSQERGHGRINRWTTWASDIDGGMRPPGGHPPRHRRIALPRHAEVAVPRPLQTV